MSGCEDAVFSVSEGRGAEGWKVLTYSCLVVLEYPLSLLLLLLWQLWGRGRIPAMAEISIVTDCLHF